MKTFFSRYTTKWEVPFYIYPKKDTFPNALSGSGYLMRSEDLECLYRRGELILLILPNSLILPIKVI